MVTKEFCEDVPRNEDVEGDVETCVNTPKEVIYLNIVNLNTFLWLFRFVTTVSRGPRNRFVRESNLKLLNPNKDG